MARSKSIDDLQNQMARLQYAMSMREAPANRVPPVTPSVVNRINKIRSIYDRYEKIR